MQRTIPTQPMPTVYVGPEPLAAGGFAVRLRGADAAHSPIIWWGGTEASCQVPADAARNTLEALAKLGATPAPPADGLRWHVYTSAGELAGRLAYVEDAAALVAVLADAVGGGTKIVADGRTVWNEGAEDAPAAESYDRVAETACRRLAP